MGAAISDDDWRQMGIDLNSPDPYGFDMELARQYAEAGVMGEWSYEASRAFLRRFTSGEQIAYEGALSNIPLVVAETASWEQVLDFRKDPEAVSKYRDLRLWLRSGIGAQSAQHAADIIGKNSTTIAGLSSVTVLTQRSARLSPYSIGRNRSSR